MRNPPSKRTTSSIRACPVARPRGAARPRVLPSRHALASRGARHALWRSPRPDRAPPSSAAFVEFLGDIVTSQRLGREIHVIADSLSTHKTQAVRTFPVGTPERAPRLHADVCLVLQPSGALAVKIERDLLARGIFTSVANLGGQDWSLHPSTTKRQTGPLGLSQSGASH
jgi:hypothetical protein